MLDELPNIYSAELSRALGTVLASQAEQGSSCDRLARLVKLGGQAFSVTLSNWLFPSDSDGQGGLVNGAGCFPV